MRRGPVLGPAQSILTGPGISPCFFPWTVSARQASLPGQLANSFTRPFCYSCFSVKIMLPVPVGAQLYRCRLDLGLSTTCVWYLALSKKEIKVTKRKKNIWLREHLILKIFGKCNFKQYPCAAVVLVINLVLFFWNLTEKKHTFCVALSWDLK